MRKVHAVLEDVLGVQFQCFAVEPLLRVILVDAAGVVEAREDVRRLEERVAPLDVVPDVHRLVALDRGIGADAATPVRAILIRDADVAAFLTPLPPVERTLQDLALHMSAVPEVGTKVLAVGIHHGELTRLCAPGDHLGVEILHPAHVAGLDLVGPRDLEPSGRLHRQRRLGHGLNHKGLNVKVRPPGVGRFDHHGIRVVSPRPTNSG